MAQVTRYECDECKRPSNGDVADWYAVRPPGTVRSVEIARLTAGGWESGWWHACGQECAMKLTARGMRELP
jgi:hypothetical protein